MESTLVEKSRIYSVVAGYYTDCPCLHASVSACRLSKITEVHDPTQTGKTDLCVTSPDSGSPYND